MIVHLNCDLEVDNIIRDITNTYQFIQRQPISPVTSDPPGTAVAGLEEEMIKEAEDKAVEEISEL